MRLVKEADEKREGATQTELETSRLAAVKMTVPGTNDAKHPHYTQSNQRLIRQLTWKFLLYSGLLTLFTVAVTWAWIGFTEGHWFGPHLKGPDALSGAGSFFSGTIGVAATLSAAYLGIVLARNALSIAEAQAATSESQAAIERQHKKRELENQIENEVREAMTRIEAIARAFVSVNTAATVLCSFGDLRDTTAKETLKRLKAENQGDPSTWAQELQDELKRAEAEQADLLFFPAEDFGDFVVAMNELANAVENAFWYVPSRQLLNLNHEEVIKFYRNIKPLGISRSFVLPTDNLLEFSQLLKEKSSITPRELSYLRGSAEFSRKYASFVQDRISQGMTRSVQGTIDPITRSGVQRLVFLSIVSLAFFGQTQFDESIPDIRLRTRYQSNLGLFLLLLLLKAIPSNGALKRHMTASRFAHLADGASLTSEEMTMLIERVMQDFDLDDWEKGMRECIDNHLQQDLRSIVFASESDLSEVHEGKLRAMFERAKSQFHKDGTVEQENLIDGVEGATAYSLLLEFIFQQCSTRDLEDNVLNELEALAQSMSAPTSANEKHRGAVSASLGRVLLMRIVQSFRRDGIIDHERLNQMVSLGELDEQQAADLKDSILQMLRSL